jgi:DnaJ family protein B protein 4
MPVHAESNGNGQTSKHKYNPRNAEDVFSEVFGSSSPYSGPKSSPFTSRTNSRHSVYKDVPENMFRNFHEGSSSSARKEPPVENRLPCTLEELYNGSSRKMRISRNIIGVGG